jgi:hypothetical protein
MRTPMEQLKDNSLFTEGEEYIQIVLKKSEWSELLEREKEEISIAYNNGIKNPYTNIWVQLSQRETTRGEIYYEERYKQNNL